MKKAQRQPGSPPSLALLGLLLIRAVRDCLSRAARRLGLLRRASNGHLLF